ncbi:hypothetical protein ACFQV4_30865 [Streptomyces thermocarboxydus]
MHLATTLTEAVGVQDVVDQTAHQLLPALGAQAMVLMTAEEGCGSWATAATTPSCSPASTGHR